MSIREGKDINIDVMVHNVVPVHVVHDLQAPFTLSEFVSSFEESVPLVMIEEIEGIYIGEFPFHTARDIGASYENGAIYLSSEQVELESMLRSAVHEVAHSIEERYVDEIYGTLTLEREFQAKRKKMFDILSTHGYTVDVMDFLDIDYSKEFDEFLFDTVGYDKLFNMMHGLFISPYAATSIREYFANAFEEYMVSKNYTLVKKLANEPYNAITRILETLN
jgi:hypothetical protein